MARAWLLFSIMTLGSGQLIYPDQIENMTDDQGRFSVSLPVNYNAPTLQTISNNQPVQIDQQFNQRPAPQFSPVKPAEGQLYSSTRVPLYSSTSPATSPETWSNHVTNIISRGITKFALDLDKAIVKTSGTSVSNYRENVIFSPLSVSVALSLVLLGSAGKTFDEVARILGLESGVDISQHSEIVHQMFGQLLAVMNYRIEGSNAPRVNSASGIFVQQGYPIRPEFRVISENSYQSEVINLDFRTKGREARNTINAWVKQQTMDKIDTILNEAPDPLTTVILLSALYFKGEWNQHFLGAMTKRKPFFIEPNNTVEVDMMYNGGNFPFYEDKSLGVKILALPYKGLEMSMYVLLPKAEGAAALKNFQDQLTPETIEDLINNMKNETCIVALPRMKLSSTLNLNEALNSLGLYSLFDPKTADLSLLSNGYGQAPLASFAPIPQPVPTSIPQAQAGPIPQPIPTSISQAQAGPVPQPFPTSIPQAQAAKPIPQLIPTSIPQASAQVPRQISPEQLPTTKFDEVLIFSRTGEHNNQGVINGARKNYFTYDDKVHGVSVEQWDTGFNIRKVGRVRRDTQNGRRRNESSRIAYITENDDLEKVEPKVGDEITKHVSLEENKYRFQNPEKHTKSRRRRQSRPVDQNFLRFLQTQNFPFYGLDNLRNSANLVNPGLYANEVLHKVEMDVTEKGTEAAATTAVLLRRDGNQKKLIANRPFMFFIRHDPTKLILFWGTVNMPTPSYAIVR
ncbi:serine protease inhibitor 28Dc [Monomorium pharaonis]|uniref:serine protease inhibitor 28Dc n=1 Tax=Monomorium pharaonis TaxID=307658 RepID=UPI00063F5C0A|nr:serine protease inhibitor 28Dc [Monomorium pharaonis]XP_012540037.1 serine protease inhibitor 28Dc [Monomorium pharaonis]XP_028045862.1 serine protease inhibitor 28Dc [Monomorium pharaonis]XP_036142618.1 serine protease inhibitor 28Dc [Monomorium pharaonis]